MSSLRVGTLRLCWLEAFVAVASAENISEAARSLSIDQSTVSRHLQALEKWLDKKLIEPGKIVDPDDPRVSIGITEAGRDFHDVAERVISDLTGFRDESAKRRDIMDEISSMIANMQADRNRRNVLPVAILNGDKIDFFQKTLDSLPEEMPVELLEVYRSNLRQFFNRYEGCRNKERRRKMPTPQPSIPTEWFEEQRQRSTEEARSAHDSP